MKHALLPTHPYLKHPRTGCPLQAVGVVNGRVIWPILGGSAPGGGGEGGGGAGDGGAGGDGGQGGGGAATYTAPASQADLDRIIEQRLSRERQKFGDYDQLKEKATRLDELELELSSDLDKATHQASEEGWNAAMAQTVPRVIRAEFRAEAKGVLTDEQLEGLLEDVDLTKYATDDGEPDLEKIKAKIAKIAPSGQQQFVRPPINLGQGRQQQSQTQPGDQGRAQAQKRFGDKASAKA